MRPKFACGACEQVVQAPAPARPIDQGLPGPGLLAHVLVSKFADHLPLYRQSEIYAREGIDLSRSTFGRGILIALNLIDWAEADRNYLKLHVGMHTHTVRGTIEGIEKKLDSKQFLRINRSSLIRTHFIRELQKWTHGEYRIILQSGHTLMWTRRYLDRHSELLRQV